MGAFIYTMLFIIARFNSGGEFKHFVEYHLRLTYTTFCSAINWIVLGLYLNILIKSKSKDLMILTYMIFTMSVGPFLIFAVPELFDWYEGKVLLRVITVLITALAVMQFILLLFNKKCIRYLKNKWSQRMHRSQSRANNSRLLPIENETILLLLDLNENAFQTERGSLLGDFFENITKDVKFKQALLKTFIAISLKFSKEKISRKNKKRHIIYFEDLDYLSNQLQLKFIKNSTTLFSIYKEFIYRWLFSSKLFCFTRIL